MIIGNELRVRNQEKESLRHRARFLIPDSKQKAARFQLRLYLINSIHRDSASAINVRKLKLDSCGFDESF